MRTIVSMLVVVATVAGAAGLGVFGAGCTTLGDARRAEGEGTKRTYEATFDEVWAVVPKAANDLDLAVAGSYKDDGYVLAERSATLMSWGERVAIFVRPLGEMETEVEVVSKGAVAVNITATDFEKSMLEKIGEFLAE